MKFPNRSDRTSVLWFVIGAGSERLTNVGRGIINLGLLALERVIQYLGEEAVFVPFRDSKVTRILQTVLETNAPVAVIASIPPTYHISTARQVFRFDSNRIGLIVQICSECNEIETEKAVTM